MAKTFAVLNGNLVTNIIVAKTKADALLVAEGVVAEYDANANPAAIGWTYDPEANTFTPPIIEETAPTEPS